LIDGSADRRIDSMITLIQFPWSPFCITVRRIMERHKIPHRIKNIPSHNREAVINATKGRTYTVPCLIDGKTTVADFTEFGQEVSRYIDRKHKLGLFPRDEEGIQAILSRYIENDLEGVGFKVNDTYVWPTLPLVERVMQLRHKERKFGKGCLQRWTRDRVKLNRQFADLLKPIDNMLATSDYLIADRPLFVDYDLYGVVENYLFSGKTKLPPLKQLQRWHRAMSRR
jgi:glutathione S-transferase